MTKKTELVHEVNGANLVWNAQIDRFMLILYDAADLKNPKPEEQIGVPMALTAVNLKHFRDQIDRILKKKARGEGPLSPKGPQ